MISRLAYVAPAAPSGAPPVRHTGTVIASCLAVCLAPITERPPTDGYTSGRLLTVAACLAAAAITAAITATFPGISPSNPEPAGTERDRA